jgi:hypothetical protein
MISPDARASPADRSTGTVASDGIGTTVVAAKSLATDSNPRPRGDTTITWMEARS